MGIYDIRYMYCEIALLCISILVEKKFMIRYAKTFFQGLLLAIKPRQWSCYTIWEITAKFCLDFPSENPQTKCGLSHERENHGRFSP